MRRRHSTALVATMLLALTACGSSDKPAPAVTVTVTVTPTLSAAEQTEACIEAVADAL